MLCQNLTLATKIEKVRTQSGGTDTAGFYLWLAVVGPSYLAVESGNSTVDVIVKTLGDGPVTEQ